MYTTGKQVASKTCTLDDFIDAKPTSQLSYYYLSLLEKYSKTEDNGSKTTIEYDVYNVLSDYIYELKKMCKTINLSDEEYYTYRFRPKLLADYLYGNGELYFIILWLNDLWSVKDFNSRTVKLISKTDLANALSSINSSEKSFINSYNESAAATTF
jgi:hypothetical protein